MSKTRRWIIFLLAIAALVLIGLNLTDQDEPAVTVNSDTPTYLSELSTTIVYNPQGSLNYKFIAQHVEYFSDTGIWWFTKPVMTQYDENKIATWEMHADLAKLTDDKMLYLYGNVVVTALTPDSQLLKITTDNAQLNLITQDVSSDDLVTLYGTTFNSSGLKMRGNLRSQTAQLIEKVKTSYEIQNKKIQP